MGYNHDLVCLDCGTDEEIDLETDGEDLRSWVVKHWGHRAKIEWWDGGIRMTLSYPSILSFTAKFS